MNDNITTHNSGSYEHLITIIDTLISLQIRISQDFPTRFVPANCAQYNRIRKEVNRLINDPKFNEQIQTARFYDSGLVALLFLGIWSLFLVLIYLITNEMNSAFWYAFFYVLGMLIFILPLGVFVLAVYQFNEEPGRFKENFYSNNSELQHLITNLFEYAYEKLKSFPLTQDRDVDTARAQNERFLLRRMEQAIIQGSSEAIIRELYKIFPDPPISAASVNERGRLLEFRRLCKENLGIKLIQRAKFGINVPLDIEHEIETWESWIATIDEKINQLN